MATSELASRMDRLNAHLRAVEDRLKLKGLVSADHRIVAAQLRHRHEALCRKLREEIADAEAHGRHVSDLKQSVRQWLDSLEIEMD